MDHRRTGHTSSTLTALAAFASALLLVAAPLQAELSLSRGSMVTQATPRSDSAAPEWVYTLAPGEAFPEVAQTLLKRSIDPARLLHHNNLPASDRVTPGQKIRIPLDWLRRQPDPARVTSVTGHAYLISGRGGQRNPLTEQSLIRVGDTVLTRSGTTSVQLADGSVIRLSPDSQLVFNRLTQYGKAGMTDTRLRLNQGEIHTQVEPVISEGSRFEIETPSAVAAVRGTHFSMQAAPGATRLKVTEGAVAFGPPGRLRSIPAGYSASVDTATSSPMEIRRLPPAPDLNPINPKVSRLPAELSWQPSQASAHQLDIFDQKTGSWLGSETVQGNRFSLDALDNGGYEIHVASMDRRGMTGMPAVLSIDVDLQARAATPITPEPDATRLDDMPEFSWEYRGENEVGRVEIAADQHFSNLVTTSEWAPDNRALPGRPLSPGQYYWRVVTEAGGNSVATSQTRKLVIDGTLPPVRIISVNYLSGQVRIFWESVETATDYRLQLAEEPGFDRIIKEATVNDTTAALRLIPGRRYFVRLKALSEGPLASRWGPGRELYLE